MIKIKKIKNFFKIKNKKESFVLKGSNWTEKKYLPIAICVGFNPWKRDIIYKYFPEYRVLFIKGKASWSRFEDDFLKKYNIQDELILVRWGNNPLPIKIKFWMWREKLKQNNVKLLSIEDGFLRSIGNGLLHTKPTSLCIDSKAIYFNANKETELEILMSTYDFKANPEIMARAEIVKNLIVSASLTKYYDINTFADKQTKFIRRKNYSILVIGQVEDDASIRYGKSSLNLNTKLVKKARKEHPDADIFFRPHPDYLHNNRKSISNINEISAIAAIVANDVLLSTLLDAVDHVYTITSLVGFEALVRGLKVTTFGVPFYAGWGLTDDRVNINRRKRKLTIEELIAASLLLYPKYLHLDSDEFVSYEETAGYFIFELLKDKDIFSLHKNNVLYKATLPYIENLSTPLKVLNYLNTTGTSCAADPKTLINMLTQDFKLVDYSQVSELLIKTSNYDILVEYSNYCVRYLNENIKTLITNTTLIDTFLYALTISLRNSNGRVISKLDNYTSSILAIGATDSKLLSISKNYLTCCSMNLQYKEINQFIEALERISDGNSIHKNYWQLEDYVKSINHFNPSVGFYKTMTSVLTSKPSRSERNIKARHHLTYIAASHFLSKINARYTNTFDVFLNNAQYYALLNELNQVESNLEAYIAKIGLNKLLGILETQNRLNHFLSLCQYLIKKKRFTIVESFLKEYPQFKTNEKYALFILTYYKANMQKNNFYIKYNTLSKEIKANEKIATLYARVLREDGNFSAALIQYELLYLSAKTLARKKNLSDEVSKLKFIIESSKILNAVAQPKFPLGVIFIASQTCFNTMAMMIPSLLELKKKGYAVISLTEGMLEKAPTGIKCLDDFEDIIPLNLTMSGSFEDLKNSWEIDWPNKKVVCNGINYYQGFYERISTTVRSYHVNLNDKHCSNEFYSNLLRVDTCLYICNEIYSKIILNTKIPVTFISGNSHVTPYSIFRDFSMNKNHERLSYINCNVAYESYFSNVGSKFASTMAVTDMTLYPTLRAPFMARRDKFESWYAQHKDDQKYLDIANKQIKVNRVGSTSNKKELDIIAFIEKEKAKGKKIVCAFGKVPVDLNVPYDGGPAHTDMADWITHTVSICNKSKDIILLVKPHPHELKPEIALDLVESFHDLIDVEINSNIILLGHKDINGHVLAPYLDLAVLYNGSTALELTAQGVPVVLTSYFGKYDYPVDLKYPIDRNEYEKYLLSGDYLIPSAESRKKSAFLISYLGTDEISTLNQYSIRQLTNDKVGIPRWNRKLIDDFLLNGDPNMEYIANKIVEKFENKIR